MTDTAKTPEQLAAEATAAIEAKNVEKAAAKAKKDAEKAEKASAKAAEKAGKDAAKAEAKAKKQADAQAKNDIKAARVAAKQPEQNGIRRPKPEGACGKVWAFADQLSAQLGQPVPIANLHATASAAAINDSTIRTQYALWRKFHGITGRVALPVAVTPTATPEDATPAA